MAKLFPEPAVKLPIDMEMAAQIAATPLVPMTVGQLIVHLQTYDPNLPVAVPRWSEHVLLEEDDIGVSKMQPHRPDGWVHHGYLSHQKETNTIDYLTIG